MSVIKEVHPNAHRIPKKKVFREEENAMKTGKQAIFGKAQEHIKNRLIEWTKKGSEIWDNEKMVFSLGKTENGLCRVGGETIGLLDY